MQAENQTVLKSELRELFGYTKASCDTKIAKLRNSGQIVTVATESDCLIIGKEYADKNEIKPLTRREYNAILGNKTKKKPVKRETSLVDLFWLIPSHRT